ncbi:hypothetical protein VHEMI10769 [[Torrubiella] hemipterigena]|uniref:Uncharacterized protein n=1 Tax=[Torrubiella] hemipterigena TaxID=1531966 RepID=A0A0A1TSG2_9HYPO|nr:hypothetical protein VHEMI10769 [[Torrubiella] hemipterigena]
MGYEAATNKRPQPTTTSLILQQSKRRKHRALVPSLNPQTPATLLPFLSVAIRPPSEDRNSSSTTHHLINISGSNTLDTPENIVMQIPENQGSNRINRARVAQTPSSQHEEGSEDNNQQRLQHQAAATARERVKPIQIELGSVAQPSPSPCNSRSSSKQVASPPAATIPTPQRTALPKHRNTNTIREEPARVLPKIQHTGQIPARLRNLTGARAGGRPTPKQ